MSDDIYSSAAEAAYSLGAAAKLITDQASQSDVEAFRCSLNEFAKRFPDYKAAIDLALPGIPAIHEEQPTFGGSYRSDSMHEAVLRYGEHLMWRIDCYRPAEWQFVDADSSPPASEQRADLDHEHVLRLFHEQSGVALPPLPTLDYQLKRERDATVGHQKRADVVVTPRGNQLSSRSTIRPVIQKAADEFYKVRGRIPTRDSLALHLRAANFQISNADASQIIHEWKSKEDSEASSSPSSPSNSSASEEASS
jgi:hypothetical protein